MVRFSGYIESKCNPVRQFEGLRYSAGSDDVVVADDDGAGFHDQHQNDAKSAVVAPFWLRSLKSDQGGLAAKIPSRHLGMSFLFFKYMLGLIFCLFIYFREINFVMKDHL